MFVMVMRLRAVNRLAITNPCDDTEMERNSAVCLSEAVSVLSVSASVKSTTALCIARRLA